MLLRRSAELPQPPPSVTILIPAKDEEQRIAACIESVLAQDYPNFRIIAIDDRSDDRTGEILDALATRAPDRMRVLHVPHGRLPDGWTGKCHALHLAWQRVADEWIFFVDSDVALTRDALKRMMTQAAGRKFDFLSVLTRLECHAWWEKLILPLAAGTVSVMYAVSMTNNGSRRSNAFANGQAMLIRSDVYRAVGGHEAVRHLITEDVELARLIKRRGYKVRLAAGDDIASTRMYDNVRQMYRGWGRIYSGLSRRKPWRILASVAFLTFGVATLLAALAYALATDRQGWLAAAAAHAALMMLASALIYRWSGNPMRYALFFPLGLGAVISLLAFALKWCITGRVEWRGTNYGPVAAESSKSA